LSHANRQHRGQVSDDGLPEGGRCQQTVAVDDTVEFASTDMRCQLRHFLVWFPNTEKQLAVSYELSAVAADSNRSEFSRETEAFI